MAGPAARRPPLSPDRLSAIPGPFPRSSADRRLAMGRRSLGSVAAAERGLHLLVEKPIAPTIDEAGAMIKKHRAAFIIQVRIAKNDRACGGGNDFRADRDGQIIALVNRNLFACLPVFADADIFAGRAER